MDSELKYTFEKSNTNAFPVWLIIVYCLCLILCTYVGCLVAKTHIWERQYWYIPKSKYDLPYILWRVKLCWNDSFNLPNLFLIFLHFVSEINHYSTLCQESEGLKDGCTQSLDWTTGLLLILKVQHYNSILVFIYSLSMWDKISLLNAIIVIIVNLAYYRNPVAYSYTVYVYICIYWVLNLPSRAYQSNSGS